MKAVICNRFGPPEGLVVETRPAPTPAAGEVVIKVAYAGVNFRDVLSIDNRYQATPPPPFCPGCEAAGVVTAVGAGVRDVKTGDRVAAFTMWGAFAEEVKATAAAVLQLPDGMSERNAAAFLLSYGTADHALHDRARLQAGETLLVLGGAGAAGLAAIEVGKMLGARVIAAASSEEKLSACREHGADATICYGTEDLRRRANELAGGNGIDVVYDTVGGALTEQALRVIAWRGRLLVIGFASGRIPEIPLNLTLLKGCSLIGTWWGEFVRRERPSLEASWQRLTAWHQDGGLKPHISATMPLAQASDALRLVGAGRSIGKVVLSAIGSDDGSRGEDLASGPCGH